MELNIEHKPAAHCENGVISALLRFNGINLSEPMIFGLASGLFFTHLPFIKMGGMAVTSFRTFPGVLFKRIMKALNIKFESRRFLNKKHSMDALDHVLLHLKKPVGCVVGMYYLPYAPIEYRFHFNGHNICIIGKKEKMNTYTVLDSNATEKVTISWRDLLKVRFPKGGVYPLMGQMYWIKSVPSSIPDLKPLILKAIHKTCHDMAFQPKFIPYVGCNGIITLSKRIRTWEMSMGPRRAKLNLAQVIRMQEEIGTGGAGFRFVYGAFLQEASERTGIQELNDFSKEITEIGDMWREFAFKAARIYKKREGEKYTYNDLGDLLERIGHRENEFFHELNDTVEPYIRHIK